MVKFLLTATLAVAASCAIAQVQIIESQPLGAKNAAGKKTTSGAASVDSSVQAELYYQVQILQEEVQGLRGLVEEQAHELKQLKQQRLDDYVDLDRRLSELSAGKAPTPRESSNSSSSAATAAALSGATGSSADELATYRAAIDLVLKQRDFDAGLTALQAYLEEYPSGNYAANAQYWVAQIYLQNDDLLQSKEWFSRMIDTFPNHQKTQEAKFKLARVYDLLGERETAKVLLNEVANSDSTAASLAKEYIRQNF